MKRGVDMTKEEIGSILKKLRIACGMTQKEVAERLGRNQPIVGHWETGYAQPDANTLFTLCNIYGVTVDDAFGFQKNHNISKEDHERIRKYKIISEYSPDGASVVDTVLDREYSIAEKLKEQDEQIRKMNLEAAAEFVPTRIIAYYRKLASAGSGDYLFDDIPTDFIKVKETEISKKADFVIEVDGRSMEPDYMDGEKVFVEKTSDLLIGEVGIFIDENDCLIKELGKNCLISRNKKYPNVIPKDGTRIVGKVIGKVEN